jgi:hypothetical protein
MEKFDYKTLKFWMQGSNPDGSKLIGKFLKKKDRRDFERMCACTAAWTVIANT